ncbi:lipoyl synthase [bacterium]|jgi:lipoyl synthase|nr:lipoyl synthase [bacterium]
MTSQTSDRQRLPEWLKKRPGKLNASRTLSNKLDKEAPNTICQEAKCPNRGECFSKGLLTFMILGTVCTRNCAFCSVRHGRPMPPDKGELDHILNAVDRLNLKFVVLTSPNRDDLPDGGASHYVHIVQGIKTAFPHVKVEVLIPDFQGNRDDLAVVVNEAKPDVLNHNVETVPSLYTTVRKGSLYKRSMDVLAAAKEMNPKLLTKTGIMMGLGETVEEVETVMRDANERKVDIMTMGQYLRPDKENLPVEKYWSPDEFDDLKKRAQDIGIRYVFSGPLVRSSYLAEHVFDDLSGKDNPFA